VLKLADYRLGGAYTVETLPATLGGPEGQRALPGAGQSSPPSGPARQASRQPANGLERLEADLREMGRQRAAEAAPPPSRGASADGATVAAELLAAAKQQATQIVSQAAEHGRRLVEELRAEMLLRAEREIAAEAARRRESAATDAAAILAQAEAQRQMILAATQREVLALALAVARRVVAQELRVSADVVLAVAAEALSHLPDGAGAVEVGVNPAELDLVRQSQATLSAAAGGVEGLVVRPDPAIAPGGCRVRTDAGDIDARIETRLAEVEAAVGGGLAGDAFIGVGRAASSAGYATGEGLS
jgi:flagellar assembly protein FliH